jgi:hypothetical protein
VSHSLPIPLGKNMTVAAHTSASGIKPLAWLKTQRQSKHASSDQQIRSLFKKYYNKSYLQLSQDGQQSLVASLFLSQSFVLFDQILHGGYVGNIGEGEEAVVLVMTIIRNYNKYNSQ